MNKNQEKILNLAKTKDISRMGFREIGRELGIKYPQTVIYHLRQLKKKGLIYFDSGKKRQRIAKTKAFVVDNFFNIPIVGSANCGPALELAEEDIQGFLKVSKRSLNRSNPNGLIVVKAVGDSLNRANVQDDNIEDGDYIIVDTKQHPHDGQYVLSVIDGAANFKKFYENKEKQEVRLVSESTLNIPPIVLHREDLESSGYLVNGVVVRVVKK